MPAFYFRVQNGRYFEDRESYDFPDLAAVRAHAFRYAGQLIADEPAAFPGLLEWRLDVFDEARKAVFALHLFAIDNPHVGDDATRQSET